MKINQLIEDNKRLVNFTLANYFPQYQYDEDMYQEGLIGLWKACMNYNENKESKFSTYAVSCIRYHINGILDRQQAEKRRLNCADNVISLDDVIANSSKEKQNKYEVIPSTLTEISCIELKQAFESLNQRNKRIVAMKAYGYSTEVIANSLCISGQTVRRIWNGIKKEVAQCIS